LNAAKHQPCDHAKRTAQGWCDSRGLGGTRIGGTPGGEAWHAELLRQMMLQVSQAHPPVLSQESVAWLDEYRK